MNIRMKKCVFILALLSSSFAHAQWHTNKIVDDFTDKISLYAISSNNQLIIMDVPKTILFKIGGCFAVPTKVVVKVRVDKNQFMSLQGLFIGDSGSGHVRVFGDQSVKGRRHKEPYNDTAVKNFDKLIEQMKRGNHIIYEVTDEESNAVCMKDEADLSGFTKTYSYVASHSEKNN